MTFFIIIRNLLWGPFTILFFLITGIFFTLQTHFVQFWGIRSFISGLRRGNGGNGISPLGAFMTSLGSTLGVGSLAGVAAAVTLGGAGAIFWMLLAAFFGMATKYAEIVLAVRFRVKKKDGYAGGPMFYLRGPVGSRSLAAIFCFFCILSTIGMGALCQSNAIAASVGMVLPVPGWLCGILSAAAAAQIIRGGARRIAHVSTILVPVMTLFYTFGALFVIYVHRNALPGVIANIWSCALTLPAAGGGFIGFFLSNAVREGFSKGVFSNEAGLGTAPIAHGSADSRSPAEQGLFGVMEVFIDTFVVCLLTGLVVLVSDNADKTGIEAIISAFSSVFGLSAPLFICISVVFLALSSIIGCSFYGEACVRYLSPKIKYVKAYRTCLIAGVAAGAVMTLDAVFLLSDIANALMAFPNLAALWYLSAFVEKETEAFRLS